MSSKIRILFLLVLGGFATSIKAQMLFVNVNSSLSINYNDYRDYSSNAKAFPYEVKLGGGFQQCQLYLQYGSLIKPLSYQFVDSYTEDLRFLENFSITKKGGGIRLNSALLGDEVGFIIHAGAYQLNATRTIIHNGGVFETEKLAPSIGLNGGIGLSIPIGRVVALTIENEFNYQKITINSSKVRFHSWNVIQFGLTIGFNK